MRKGMAAHIHDRSVPAQSRHVQRCPAAIGDGGAGLRALCQQPPRHISVSTTGRTVQRRSLRLRQGTQACAPR